MKYYYISIIIIALSFVGEEELPPTVPGETDRLFFDQQLRATFFPFLFFWGAGTGPDWRGGASSSTGASPAPAEVIALYGHGPV